jgi:hypothetical protein
VTRSQIAGRSLVVLLATIALAFIADYCYLRIRMMHATATEPFESMTRTRVLAIPQKNGKFDYQIDQQQPAETLTCVHSLFSHYGDQPCWYMKPRLDRPIPVT